MIRIFCINLKYHKSNEGNLYMYISKIVIKGFRSLQDVESNLTKYSTLIGKNDSGKSSFLKAIQLLFDSNTNFKPDDPCRFPEQGDEYFIEGVIEDCSNADLKFDGNQLRIRRTFANSQSQLNYWGRVPRLDTLKRMAEGTLTKGDFTQEQNFEEEVKEFAKNCLDELCPTGRVPKETWQELYKRLEDENFVEYEDGWSHLDSQTLSSIVQVVMLEADVRGEEQVTGSGRSVLNQVGGLLLRESTKNYPGIADAVGKLNDEIIKVATKNDDGKWLLDDLNNFESVLSEEVQRFDTTVVAQPTLTPPKLPNVEFSVNVSISDEWIDGLDKMGHGLRRSVVFAMLRAHRRLKEKDSQLKIKTDSPLYLFLVEEPELYLHPQAERRRMKELKELAEDENAQVILCTHSAIFVDLTQYEGILRFNRPSRKETTIQSWKGQKFKANDQKTLATTYKFDPNRSAMLFADLVILVEGQSEKISITHIAENMGLDSPNKEVEIVDCGGNTNIPVYQLVVEGFGIKYVAWLDSDDAADIERVKQIRTERYGKIIITEENWEKMTELPDSKQKKTYRSWKYFVFDENKPNQKVKERIIAAYNWQDFE